MDLMTECIQMNLKRRTMAAVWIIYHLLLISFFSTLILTKHICDRQCVKGKSKECHYDFVFDRYYTMSKACFNCPLNISDCYRPMCITGNGVVRLLYTANVQLPGPTIAICQNDTLVVNVKNKLDGLTTSIHWHGMTQIGTPFMDGVPFVTQCPILPNTNFQYKFKVYQSGTYFWHSHVFLQLVDGLAGMLIVRQPPREDPNDSLYDLDLSDHAILVSDWDITIGSDGTKFHLEVLNLTYKPPLLINGKGQKEPFTRDNGSVIYTPLQEFKVKSGFKYRFRMCNNANSECPTKISIDNHTMTIIAADGIPVKALKVDSIISGPGERYDFVVHANYSDGNYWIRFQSTGNFDYCSASYSAANLKYEDSIDRDLTQLYEPIKSDDKKDNVLETIANLKSLVKDEPLLNRHPIKQFYFEVGLIENNHPLYYNPKYFPWSSFYPTISDAYSGNDTGYHTFHLHGHSFQVVAQGYMPPGLYTVAEFKVLDAQGKVERKLNGTVTKDSVMIPFGGYTILRFIADNPGMWLFHCHMDWHFANGMGLIMQVGEPKDFTNPPKHFPTCGDFSF
ncbi:hypothetical protein CHUAL_004365 [Chamberlinius hualienensis]